MTTLEPASTTTVATVPTATTVRPTTASPTAPATGGRTILLPEVSDLGVMWAPAFVIPYGDAPEMLGTTPGDDDTETGPAYGARTPDGTWWILDDAKRRLAHYSAGGGFLGAVELTDAHLPKPAFRYRLPHVLDDGTFVATAADTGMLLMREGDVEILEQAGVPPVHDDGVRLYGWGDDGVPLAFAPGDAAEPVDWIRARSGERFSLVVATGEIRIMLPDVPIEVVLPVTAPAEIGGDVHLEVEFESTVNGTLHLLILGRAEGAPEIQLGGYLTVGPNGTVSGLEPIRDPHTDLDPGTPARLGVRPGTNEVSLMFVDPDGIRVHYRTG